jgi:hypothetical protein
VTEHGPELTDVNNRTGNIAEYGKNTERYFEYLRKMGVPTEIFKNMPKTPEEIEEEKLLGRTNKDLNWFKGLDIFQQSKYIGRNHQLTDEQFDYLWNENEQKLLNQYVSTGRALNSYQLNKIASKTSLKNSYFKAREQAVSGDDKYEDDEYLIMTPKQIDFNPKMDTAARGGHLDIVKLMIEKGANDFNRAIVLAAGGGHLDIVKLMIEKGATNFRDTVSAAAFNRQQDVLDYLDDYLDDQGYVYVNDEYIKPLQPLRRGQPAQQPAQSQTAQQPAQPVRNPWLSRMRSKVGI